MSNDEAVETTDEIVKTAEELKLDQRYKRYENRVADRKRKKVKRKSLSGGDRLTVPQHIRDQYEDKHLRWFNDVDSRIPNAIDSGYAPVYGDFDVGDPRTGDSRQPGSIMTKNVGGGRTAILMQIPQVYYDADQEAKQKKLDKTEESMKRTTTAPDADGLYGTNSIETNRAA